MNKLLIVGVSGVFFFTLSAVALAQTAAQMQQMQQQMTPQQQQQMQQMSPQQMQQMQQQMAPPQQTAPQPQQPPPQTTSQQQMTPQQQQQTMDQMKQNGTWTAQMESDRQKWQNGQGQTQSSQLQTNQQNQQNQQNQTTNTQGSSTPPTTHQINNNDAQSQKQHDQMDKMQQAQQQRMASQMKQMAKQLQNAIALFTKAQTKLQKSGLSLSSDCTQALGEAQSTVSSLQSGSSSDQVDTNSVMDVMQNLGQCRTQASQLVQAPVIMKTLTRAHDRLLKKNLLSDSDKQDWDTLAGEYATLKSGTFDDGDVFSFFDDARGMAESFGMNPNSIPQIQPPQAQNQGGIGNMGAAVSGAIKNVGDFFHNLFR